MKCFADGELPQKRKKAMLSAVQISHPAVTLGLLAGSFLSAFIILPFLPEVAPIFRR